MGLLSAGAGVLIGLLVSSVAIGEGYELFPVYAGAAAFITASGLWWALLARQDTYTITRGATVGAVAGTISHYLCWYLFFLGANICYWLFGGCRSSLGEPPVDPVNALWGAGLFSVGSLLFFGWLTVPAGMVIGGFLAARQRGRRSQTGS